MRRGPAAVSRLILANTPVQASPVALLEAIAREVWLQGWADTESEALELAEQWHDPVLRRIRSEVGALHELGRPPRVTFNSSSDYMIQGACFVEGTDSEETRAAKARRLLSVEYCGSIRKLTPTQFEALCGRLLSLLGVRDAVVTRRSGDEGVDFYGLLRFDNVMFSTDLTPTIQRQLGVWLVGQAKQYPDSQVGTAVVRELVGAIALGREGATGSQRSPFESMKIRPADPVVALVITSGSLSRTAWRLFKKSGVAGMDGEMVGAFLADRGAGWSGGSFSHESFMEWLRS